MTFVASPGGLGGFSGDNALANLGGGSSSGGGTGGGTSSNSPPKTSSSPPTTQSSQGSLETVTVSASRNQNLQACKATVHVAASGIGGAVGGFIAGGPLGATIGGGIGLLAGGAEVALGVYAPGVRGAVLGGAGGALESAANGEGVTGGAIVGVVRGGFGETYGVGAAAGTAVVFGEAIRGGFGSLTPAARGVLSIATRGVLAGWGAGFGLITQKAAELFGEQACEAAFGDD